jgi:putative membrane protein
VGHTAFHFAVHALSISVLGAAAGFYFFGVKNLWNKAGRWRGIQLVNLLCFSIGWLVVAIALLSPLHHLAERLLSAHMVQHELLMVVAAPLLVLGRPIEAFSWVLPLRIPKILSDPLFAWALHAVAVWIWHVPALFETALENEWVHLAQHSSFFLSAAVFWWSVFSSRNLGSVFSLFTTMLYTGALGALMTLSRASWYPGYALEDQQLAGLVMWIPAGTVYPIAALWLVSRTLRRCAT